MYFDVQQWTIDGSEVPLLLATANHFNVQETLKYCACFDTPDATAPKSSMQAPQLERQVPVVAEATGATLHIASMGQRGEVASNVG